MDSGELQRRQAAFDEQYWQHGDSRLEDVRHITLHVVKLSGKLAAWCERMEHGEDASHKPILEEVIPDLMFYANHLGNTFGVDVAQAYLERLAANAGRHDARTAE